MKNKNRDNIPGFTFDRPWKYLLLPGVIFQWGIYMSPGKGFRGVAASTRSARSPLMTYVFAAAVWIGLLIFLLCIINERS
jgi:hypothetical protein